MTSHNDWILLTKTKALLIRLSFDGSYCADCMANLLDDLDGLWLDAGRDITTEMRKYQDVWIEGNLEREAANATDDMDVHTIGKHSRLH